jgi:hypothetical protein
MKKETWAWIIGIAVFCAIAGAWAFLLPKTLVRVAGGRDAGLSGIISSLGDVKQTAGSDLSRVQANFEDSLKKMNDAISADRAQAAAIGDLKQRLDAMSAEKEKDSNADAPQGGLSSVPEKSSN